MLKFSAILHRASLLLGLILFGLGLSVSSSLAQMPASQKSEIESIVKDYLLNNPEILRDALTELDRREKLAAEAARRKAVTDLAPQIFNSNNQVVVGNPKGKVTLVEFFDYNCTYCKRTVDDIQALMKADPDLRVVLKEFPVLGPGSVEAAQVATALRNQLSGDKYWAFHRRFLTSRGPANKAAALAAAKETGIDMDRLNKDIDRPDVRASIEESMKIADSLSLTGTPSFVIGDEVIVGAVGLDELKARIGNVRKCGHATCG
jgi:protein-disulfide isomerase